MKKHKVSYHDHDDLISFYSDHFNHLDVFEHLYSNQTKKKDSFSEEIFSDKSKIIENKEIKIFLEKITNSKMILKRVDFSERLNESQKKSNERRLNKS
jgi:hypothetical protein